MIEELPPELDGFLESTGSNALAAFLYHCRSAQDWAKQVLRDRMNSVGIKTMKTDGFEVKLITPKKLGCVCHSLDPQECHSAGESIQLMLIEQPAFLTVAKRTDGHYGNS